MAKFIALALLAIVFSNNALSGKAQSKASELTTNQPMLQRFTDFWVGSFSNERQVTLDRLNGEPEYPESVRLLRDMKVYRVNAPAIGPSVLYLQEVKADNPGKVHRQRVMTFNWKPETQEIEVEQLFFAPELTYDQHPISPSDIAKMTRSDFNRETGCDLFFKWDERLQRFKGGMRPRACAYVHPVSGKVFAEFDMILTDKRLWYRDRSIKLVDGSIRGEIDGFSWLRFDRLSNAPDLGGGDRISLEELRRRAPLTARMEGIWEGTFRRYDAQGVLIETLPSHIEVRFLPDGHPNDYLQTNVYKRDGKPDERIDSVGKWDVDRLRFANPRLDGWAQDVAADPAGLTSVFTMTFKDGSGMTVSEIVSLSPDGKSRSRAAQYRVGGKIVRRTLIDEVRRETP